MFISNHAEVLRRNRRAIIKFLHEAGGLIKTDAKERAPWLTGNLSRSINDKVNEAQLYVEIGTPVKYAAAQEFGTSRMKAQPYLRPAGDNNRDKIKILLQRNLKKL